MSKKTKIDIDEILEEVAERKGDTTKKISKIEEKKILNDVKEAVNKGGESFSKVKIYTVVNGDEYFIMEAKYDDDIIKDTEKWVRERVVPNVPEKYLSDTYIIKGFTPDGSIAFEKQVKVAIPEKRDDSEKLITEKVKSLLELQDFSTKTLIQQLSALQLNKGSNEELMKEFMKLIEEMIRSLKEEKEKIINEIKEKERDKSEIEIMKEIITIEKTFDDKIEKLINIMNQLKDTKDDASMQMIMKLIEKLIDKQERGEIKEDPIDQITKIITLVEKMSKKDEGIEKQILEQIIQKAIREEKDPMEEFEKQLTLLSKIKEVFAPNDSKDDTLTLMTLFEEKLHKLEEMQREREEKIIKLIESVLASRKEEKDELTKTIEAMERLKQMARIYQEITGTKSQPVKSFMELIAQILNSPIVENAIKVIADAIVRQEMIRQGIIITDDGQILQIPRVVYPAIPTPIQPIQQGFAGYQNIPQQVQPIPKEQKKEEQVEEKQKEQPNDNLNNFNEEEVFARKVEEIVKKIKNEVGEYKEEKADKIVSLAIEEILKKTAEDKEFVMAILKIKEKRKDYVIDRIVSEKIKEIFGLNKEQLSLIKKKIKEEIRKYA